MEIYERHKEPGRIMDTTPEEAWKIREELNHLLLGL